MTTDLKQVCIHSQTLFAKRTQPAIRYTDREAEKKEAGKVCDALLYDAWEYYAGHRNFQ